MPDRGIIGRTIAQYRIDKLLGQGGMAAVFEATDTKLERQVAIKIMHPHLASQRSFQERFLQEARAAASLDHRNIIRVLSFDNVDNELFLVMELVTGGNLRKYIKRLHEDARFIDYPEAIELVSQMADALDYAHRQGMIHRDIKPDNVLLKSGNSRAAILNYVPILTDFGLAKLTSGGENAVTDQQPLGTYPYMSPEQCYGENVDARSDIYSLGIMLYELAVGQLPYQPKTIGEAARMHGREPLTLPSALRRGFPDDLEKVILKSLHKEAGKRYQSAGDMAFALRELQPSVPGTKIPAAPERKPHPRDEEELATDVATDLMDEPLPAELPLKQEGFISDEDRGYDRLVFYRDAHNPLVVRLEAELIDIGRGFEQDVVLDGSQVSRRHIRLERKPNGRYYLIDVGSSNGTWLDDERLLIDKPVILAPGATVRLGDYWMQLDLKEISPDLDTDGGASDEAPAVIIEEIGEDEPASEPEPKYVDPVANDESDGDSTLIIANERVEDSDDGLTTAVMDSPIPREMPFYSPPPLTAEQAQHDRLVFLSEVHPVFSVRIEQDMVRVGRAEDRDIILRGEEVSRHHALIERQPDGNLYITDIGSANGVWMGNDLLEANIPMLLEADKIVRIGSYWIKFEPKRELPLAFLGVDGEGAPGLASLETVQMVRPLAEDIPLYSPPPMSAELRASDRLVLFSEDHPLQVVKFDKVVLTVGRDEDRDIVLHGKRVSRHHARIEAKPDGHLYVTDTDSTNGVWVGDTLLVSETEVQWDLDEIVRIGNYWMKFERGTDSFDLFQGSDIDDRGLVGTTIKNYQIDRFLGHGPVAAVYKGTDTRLQQPVALKILYPNLAAQPTTRRRFLQEARVLSRLDHPNIVHVLSYDDVDNEVFLVMELITGGTLRAYLNRLEAEGRRMEFAEVVNFGAQMADALHYAHQQGMMHRDIKPENVVLKPGTAIGPLVNYVPILTDFELARLAESGEIFVTDKPDVSFPYMSPEQTLGERIDIRSDIYELGIIVHELATGRPPFMPRSMAEAVRMHSREALPDPAELRPDFPDELAKVLMEALEKSPNDRFQTAAEMSRALQRVAFLAQEDQLAEGIVSVPIDAQITEVMDDPIPAAMPPHTRQPITESLREHDRLVIYSDDRPTQVLRLNKDLFTIGRGEDQDIILDGTKVSRRHARIERSFDHQYRIIDVHSINGSWLGDYRLIPDVAEVWETDLTVRIGEFWLRIETAHDLIPEYSSGAESAPGNREAQVDARPRNVHLPPPEHDKIGVTVTTPNLQVAPGTSATMPVEIVNRSEVVDHFHVEVTGLPPDWYTQPVEPLHLLPNNRDTTSITFHPPLASSSSAGGHAFGVRVISRAQGVQSVRTQGSLEVAPYYRFTSDLQPLRIKGRGRAELAITNTGNTFETYSIEVRDREQAVKFDMGGRQFTLPPGHTEYVPIRMIPKSRSWLGTQQIHSFEATVTPDHEEGTGPQLHAGELVVAPVFPIWMIGALMFLCAICTVLSLFGYVQLTQINAQNQTIEAVTKVAIAGVTATAVAESDTDGDRLTNAREVELGTDPNIADTDDDGLLDGEEQAWQTDPLARDTDGDTLSDGDEVHVYGSNPLKVDSDDDGIPDNEDTTPATRSTETPTPFPTVEGSNGDICAGSPVPARMKVGEQGIVEPGGVANRLRDKPGKQEGAIVGFMQPEANFQVIGGPECDPEDQIRWWQVDFNGLEGWTAEGEGEVYYIMPPSEDEGEGDSITPVEGLDSARMGVQVDANSGSSGWQMIMARTEPLQVGWVKLQASWRSLEPDFAGQYDQGYRDFQSHLEDARSRGYKVLVSIAKAPDWARSNDISQDGPPDDPQEIARFISTMLDRVGDSIDAIEIWNEPNLDREWNGSLPATGGGYMQLFRPAYDQIREYSSSITIVTAGLAPTGDSENSRDDRVFLRQMYDAGLADYEDVAIGIHPYSWGNAPDARCCDLTEDRGWDDRPQFFFMDNLEAYRSLMLEYGHRSARLWATEFGWATWEDFPGDPPEPWMVYNTPDNQLSYTVRAFEIGQERSYMGPMFLWNLNFANPATVENRFEAAGYSLLFPDFNDRNNLQVRPLYHRLTTG